jgi:hypothetical protein
MLLANCYIPWPAAPMTSVWGGVRAGRQPGDLLPRLWSVKKAHVGWVHGPGVPSSPGLLAPRGRRPKA